MPVGDARRDLAEVLNRVAYCKERILLERHGKEVAALVPLADFRLIEALRKCADIESATTVLRCIFKADVLQE
jgi:prevent-host-death family protein